jgi:hypothetical protein
MAAHFYMGICANCYIIAFCFAQDLLLYVLLFV